MRRLWLTVVIAAFLCVFLPPSVHADVGPCDVFPADNVWNRDISAEPVHPQSAAIIAYVGIRDLHPDFGGSAGDFYGIPWITVNNSQTDVDSITFDYDDESDPGPYPIPYDAPIEGGGAGGDRHVLVIKTTSCMLYELYASEFTGDPSDGVPNTWTAGSGAIFNLNSNALRPDGWTSADAAGLPVFPGLARCDEASAGPITHALRFTATNSKVAGYYVFPARHEANSNMSSLALPLGARLRLRADYPIPNGMPTQAKNILLGLKRYGMILADNGSNWYISGDYPYVYNQSSIVIPPCTWDDDSLDVIKDVSISNFEVLAYPGTSAPTLPHFATATPTLTWSRITWAVSYEIQVADNTSFTSATTYTSAGTSFTIPGPGLAEDTYYWRVRGKDASGVFGAYSASGTFVIALIP